MPWKWENLQTHLSPVFLSNVSEMILLILNLNLQSLYEFNFQLCQHDFCQSKWSEEHLSSKLVQIVECEMKVFGLWGEIPL